MEPPFEVVEAESEPVPGAFDLGLRMHGTSDRPKATLLYREDLFEAGTIERMSQHFLQLLESVVSRPETPIGDSTSCRTDERALVLAVRGWRHRISAAVSARVICRAGGPAPGGGSSRVWQPAPYL